MRTEVEQLRRLIQAAFPSVPFVGAVVDRCRCDECADVENALQGRSWAGVPREVVEAQFGTLPLLSGKAYQAFLPAWLMLSLDSIEQRDYKLRQWTVYDLAIYVEEADHDEERSRNIERVRRRKRLLTSEQADAVAAFLRLIRQNSGISEWDRKSIDLALELVWK